MTHKCPLRFRYVRPKGASTQVRCFGMKAPSYPHLKAVAVG